MDLKFAFASIIIVVLCILLFLDINFSDALVAKKPLNQYVTSSIVNPNGVTQSKGAISPSTITSTSASYQCSTKEKAFQHEYSDIIFSSICDSHTPWKMAQMTMPDASVFIDVGCNRAYVTALIFALWSPGENFSPMALKEAMASDLAKKITHNGFNDDTVCADGRKPAHPYICPGRIMDQTNPKCSYRRPIQVFGFDGQLSHVQEQRTTIYSHFPNLNPNATQGSGKDMQSSVKSSFEYIHAAMTDNVDSADEKGYFKLATDEGGSLVRAVNGTVPEGVALVPIKTIDRFCEERGECLNTADMCHLISPSFNLFVYRPKACGRYQNRRRGCR
jgi:hypothetical protein